MNPGPDFGFRVRCQVRLEGCDSDSIRNKISCMNLDFRVHQYV